MDWLGKLLFPRANRHDRQLRMGSLWLLAGLVVIGAVVAVLLYFAIQPRH
jgi:ABC-type dipeptide/oligopeptide/nickel transport system permease component